MKIGAIIFSRYNSTRLPGKVLKEINGKPLILYIYERLLTVFDKENIVIATSDEKTDDPIFDFCTKNEINCFRGSLNDVAKRFLDCSLKYNFDYAFRVTGDSIFVDKIVLNEMKLLVEENKYDLISNRKNRTFPVGMSVDILKTSFYKEMYSKFNKDGHFEHVTTYFFENENQFNIKYYFNNICPEAGGIHFAIDEKSDFDLAEKIIRKFEKNHTEYGIKEIYQLYKDLK